jgi:anti-sigma regulatory factor (Ser/Thr protein kinase)
MNRSEECIFLARRDQLALATDFVAAFCERLGVAAGDAARLTLIVEELFANTLMHGHRGDHDSPVHIELAADPMRLALRYADRAPPFDPLQYLADMPLQLDRAIEEREPGGLGLPLVAQMCERFDYVHVDGFNRLSLVLRRET